MQTRHIHKDKSDGIFLYLLILTGFFLLLEISFFIQCNKTYLSDFTFVSNKLDIPLRVLPGIFFFISAQLMVHLVYCISVWAVTLLITGLLQVSKSYKITIGISIWLFGIVTIFIANQYFFPNSKFSMLTGILLSQRSAKIVLFVLMLGCLFLIFLAAVGLINRLVEKSLIYLLAFFLVSITIILVNIKTDTPITKNIATSNRPNIILVGVDSLRPDYLSYFGYENSTPFFDSFLNQSSVFSEAVTPLARTFPSWTSILSGKYPRQMGIRFNLAQQGHADFKNTLPAILQRNGYETIYATDETRFSNIDKNFGFDRVITPPVGLNDFLIGTFNDFPISNLLVNTPVGKWLFPHSYANRPVYFTYEPKSFLNLIKPALREQREKPLFFAIHFCLTHHPYLWASLAADDFSVQELYGESVGRVDKQLQDFFAMLKEAHILDHAIVVLLSDHGEALELPGDRITERELFSKSKGKKISVPKFYPPSLEKEEVNQSAGHGTDVLSLPQYHTLLAFRLYGVESQRNGVIPGLVSLLDIKPTLLQLIGLDEGTPNTQKNKNTFSGESLVASIKSGEKLLLPHGDVFLESDFSPESIRTVYPETRKVLLEGVQLFQVDPITTRLTVKESMGNMIINSKQYADIYGEWMLALYPQNNKFRMPILINLVTGEWTNDLKSDFAHHSPATHMMEKLKAFYQDEIADS